MLFSGLASHFNSAALPFSRLKTFAGSDGIVKAYQTGKEKRAEVDDAIVKGQRIIQAATEHVSNSVVNELVDEAVKSLPAEVTALPAPAAR